MYAHQSKYSIWRRLVRVRRRVGGARRNRGSLERNSLALHAGAIMRPAE